MIRRIILLLSFCVLTGCLYSCFEIKENIRINEDGSGSYSFLMDVSQLKPIFAMSRDFQRSMGDTSARAKSTAPMPNPLLQMKAKFDALQPKLEAVAGISHYKTVCDTSSYIIGAQYSFNNIESLNNSINVLRNSSGNGGAIESTHYAYSNRHFEKINDISKANVTGSSSKNDSLTNELFKGARYTLTCTFDRKIKEVSNPLYFISADGKTLLYSGSLLDIMNQKTNIGNAVILH
jgi:predicted outer membrane repeat protein